MDERPDPLGKVVGDAMRALRVAAGVPADKVARVAQLQGLNWERSTVASIETQRRGLSAEELLLLPGVLSGALGRQVNLGELFPRDVAVTDGAHATPAGIAQVLEGREQTTGRRGEWYFPILRQRGLEAIEHAGQAIERSRRKVPPEVPSITVLQAAKDVVDGPAGDAERKAARKVGRTAWQVATAARQRWGWTLTEERDRLVSERLPENAPQRTVQAVRGRVTRQLVAELAEDLATYPRGD